MARRPATDPIREAESHPLSRLARSLGIPDNQTAWLEQALTHRSYTREQGEEERESNERLEFLGDAIAQLIVSMILYERYPRWTEGQLTRARSSIVSREPMRRAAVRIRLGQHLKLGKTEDELGGRERASILSSAFEAVVAAAYLTSGVDTAARLIRGALDEELQTVDSSLHHLDYKTRLQELCQARIHLTPCYRMVGSTGPEHERYFTSEVLIGDEVLGTGAGRSKKDAEKAAARAALNAVAANACPKLRSKPVTGPDEDSGPPH